MNTLSIPSATVQNMHDSCLGPAQPILFVVTPGVDPTQELQEYAARKMNGKLRSLSMGQGQEKEAYEALEQAINLGSWLFLSNIHFVTSWLPQVEKLLNSVSDTRSTFRLWLTSENHPNFPTTLLQRCIRVTVEAPPGIKKNMLRTFDNWSKDYFANGSVIRSQLLFAMSWFHAVFQERRNYLPQGWDKFYEFSSADLRTGADVLDV